MRKIVGLIGYPLGHSVSPAMHNAAFKELGLDYEYIPFEVEPEDLAQALPGLRALHIAGFNVTIPHKEAVVPLLDDVTKLARTIGAVNTVVNQEGKLIGYNTDGPGFIESLKEDAGFEAAGKRAVVLGAGGAGRAVATMLAEVGAAALFLADLDAGKAAALTEYVDTLSNTKCGWAGLDSLALKTAIEQADLLVNATPLGMHPDVNKSPLPAKVQLPKSILVYDLVYNPAETKLLKTARAAGCRAVSGLGMLVQQGALAFTVFTGEEAPLETMLAAARKALR
ncbi:MAG: shikimate dehydrogenase [Candidatus Saganbacteria bacterium]|nr:shikimate dehydrogenase [Candidatus Saganbacteria bacterium]